MTRPTGVFKRSPRLGNAVPNIMDRYAAISKAQWAELYRDLFAATQGEDMDDGWLPDAEARLVMLKLNGLAGG